MPESICTLIQWFPFLFYNTIYLGFDFIYITHSVVMSLLPIRWLFAFFPPCLCLLLSHFIMHFGNCDNFVCVCACASVGGIFWSVGWIGCLHYLFVSCIITGSDYCSIAQWLLCIWIHSIFVVARSLWSSSCSFTSMNDELILNVFGFCLPFLCVIKLNIYIYMNEKC